MGYYLHGFLGQLHDLQEIKNTFNNSVIIPLTNQIGLIPMSGDLFDEINNYRVSNDMEKFEFMTAGVEQAILVVIKNRMIAYVEADYFGGHGGQSGVVWKEGKRIFLKNFEQDVINEILRMYGVTKNKSGDEFDAVQLGRHRSTEEWITGNIA